jgi:hypothetical protein
MLAELYTKIKAQAIANAGSDYAEYHVGFEENGSIDERQRDTDTCSDGFSQALRMWSRWPTPWPIALGASPGRCQVKGAAFALFQKNNN